MSELLTPGEMRAVDDYAVRQLGIPSPALMESAGAKVVEVIERVFGRKPSGRSVVVLAGKGNNGGDGSVVARRLMGKGWHVSLVLTAQPSELKGDASVFWQAAVLSGVPCFQFSGEHNAKALFNSRDDLCLPQALQSADLVVDALLGTGARLAPQGAIRQVIDLANASRVPILAVDVPSGIDCATGQIPGICIVAQETVTFCHPKTGMMQYPAARACGRLWIADIGIPQAAVSAVSPACRLITRDDACEDLPSREPWAHKGDAGRALILSGSARYPGAPYLCATGCIRAGAGLVTAVVPGAIWPVMAVKLSEVMVLRAGRIDQETFDAPSLDTVQSLLQAATAVCVGPGITIEEETRAFLEALLASADRPMVLDADALTMLAGSDALRSAFAGVAGRTAFVLTPHPAEAARLLGCTTYQVQADRMTAARGLASKYQCVVVLKGARTIVAQDNRMWVNLTGNPGLATGGTGDVLAGVITALLAQGASAICAARTGVFLHGLAADIVASKRGTHGMTAGDVAEAIPEAIQAVHRDACHLLEYAMHV